MSEGGRSQIHFETNSKLNRYKNANAIQPTKGPQTGGTQIWVSGTIYATQIWCKFGHSVSEAQSVSGGSRVTCISPARSAGNVTLSVSANGVDFTSAPGYFEYTSNVVMTSLVPSVGGAPPAQEVVSHLIF